MCGICGTWDLAGNPVDPELVHAMRQRVAHRGPDDAGTWVDAQHGVALREHETGIRLAVENMFPWRARNREYQAYLPGWDPSDETYAKVMNLNLRLMKKLNLRPRRTVRVVLWTNEENGLRGANVYAQNRAAEAKNHVLAFESDSGVDLTPCHDAKGNWDPGPNCTSFPLAPGDSKELVLLFDLPGAALAELDEHREAVGPEGGWSPKEIARIGDRGVTLGPLVLRTDTAGVAAAAKVLLQ